VPHLADHLVRADYNRQETPYGALAATATQSGPAMGANDALAQHRPQPWFPSFQVGEHLRSVEVPVAHAKEVRFANDNRLPHNDVADVANRRTQQRIQRHEFGRPAQKSDVIIETVL
jgi:hypothetical protein